MKFRHNKKTLRFSIRQKMLFYFGLLFIMILTILKLTEFWGLPFTGYKGEIMMQQIEVLKSLGLFADQKKERLLRWLEERKDDTKVLAEGTLKRAVAELQSSIQKISIEKTGSDIWEEVKEDKNFQLIIEQLRLVKETYGVYNKIDIIDFASGKIIASTDNTQIGSVVTHVKILPQFQLSGSILTEIHRNIETDQLELEIQGAITDHKTIIAVLLMHVNIEDMIRPMLLTGEGLGITGEVLLIDKKVRILTRLKYPLPDGTVPMPLKYTIKTNPAKFAARGGEGITTSKDYRGESVLAAYRYIPISPETGWGLVVKWDKTEIFAAMYENYYYSIGIGFIGIMVTLYLTYLIASKLSLPLKIISQTAEKVAKGDLNVHIDLMSEYREAQTMADTFNLMIKNLKRTMVSRDKLEREIIERKRVEIDLREEEKRVRLLLDSTAEGIYGVNLDGNCTFANPSCLRILGYEDVEQLIGKNMHNLIHHTRKEGTSYPVEECRIYLAFREGKTTNVADEVFWRPNRTSFPIEYWSHPIWKDGKAVGTVVTFVDITERKKAEEDLKDLNVELADKNKELEQLVYIASHDMRSPLLNIQGFSEEMGNLLNDLRSILEKEDISPLLKDKVSPIIVKDIPHTLNRILLNSEKMDTLLSGLLRLSRIGNRALKTVPLNMNKLVSNIVEAIRYQIEEKGAVVEIDNLPSCYGDESQINQVFSNLLDNALKYLDDNRKGYIRVSGRKEAERVVYCVEDNGRGIHEDYHKIVFELFHQLDPKASEGEGLGLVIVTKIISRHGGKVWVESKQDQGSRFYVSLPI